MWTLPPLGLGVFTGRIDIFCGLNTVRNRVHPVRYWPEAETNINSLLSNKRDRYLYITILLYMIPRWTNSGINLE